MKILACICFNVALAAVTLAQEVQSLLKLKVWKRKVVSQDTGWKLKAALASKLYRKSSTASWEAGQPLIQQGHEGGWGW